MTKVFLKNLKAYQNKTHRIICNEGGTGSSKSYSLAQLMSVIMAREKSQITIARKTLPALKATAMKDFFNWLKLVGCYRDERHNKTENVYRYPKTKTEIDFLSIDDPSKVRSRRRNYLWVNEANELSKEDYMQLSMRTDKQIFLDYNPSHQYHWIYDDIQTRKDCLLIRSTYKDNPFLPPELIKEIEGYKDKDQNYWRIYGLGLRGIAEALVITHWQYCDELPESFDKMSYGVDFGYNNPSAITKVVEKDKDFYWDEKLYQTHLTNQDLIAKMKALDIGDYDEIYPDKAEPARIKEIKDAGFNVKETKKDVNPGIDFIKSRRLFITKRSVNLIKELQSYMWKTKDGKVAEKEEPIKENDHLISAGRYAQYSMSQETEFKFS